MPPYGLEFPLSGNLLILGNPLRKVNFVARPNRLMIGNNAHRCFPRLGNPPDTVLDFFQIEPDLLFFFRLRFFPRFFGFTPKNASRSASSRRSFANNSEYVGSEPSIWALLVNIDSK